MRGFTHESSGRAPNRIRFPHSQALQIAGIVLFVAMLFACNNDDSELIFDDDYGGWERTVEEPLNYPIPGHGKRRRAIYINDTGTGVERVTDETGLLQYEYPEGTIVVKEVYTDFEGSDLLELTIMIKAPDDERARKGWIWLNKDAKTGKEKLFTSTSYCLTCHEGANESHPYGDGNPNGEFRDYVFFPYGRVENGSEKP